MGWDELMETLKKRFEEQKGARGRQQVDRHRRHEPVRRLRRQPAGHPHRPGQGRNRSAVKVWDQRAYKDYDDTLELGSATSRSRSGACGASHARAASSSSTSTTRSTRPANAGMLDIKMIPSATTR